MTEERIRTTVESPDPSKVGPNQIPIAVRRSPPKNVILPEKVVDEFRRKLDGIILDNDLIDAKLDRIIAAKAAADLALSQAVRMNLIRDIIMILLLVVIGACVGYNTIQFHNWG